MKMVDLAEHPEVLRMYPAIGAAAIEVGTPQIRNQATVGGNLNQRPRCWYFRNEEFVCLKKGGDRCFSPAGENQFHAIFWRRAELHCAPLESRGTDGGLSGATFRLAGPKGRAVGAGGRLLRVTEAERAGGECACARRTADSCVIPCLRPAM